MKPKFPWITCLLLIMVQMIFAACSLIPAKTSPSDLTATSVALTPTQPPNTPTPLPPLAILLLPEGADTVLAQDIEQAMKALASSTEMRFQIRPSLSIADLSPDMAIVVVLPPNPDLAALAQAAPEIQFIAVGVDGITAGENISLIHAQDYEPKDLAFIAGFIAGVITPDWRAGILLPPDQAIAAVLLQAYSNGLHYWCGLCLPAYPPFDISYPQSAQVANPADAVATLTTVDMLFNAGVKTVYVPPEISTTALLEYMAGKQMMMIGTDVPPSSVAHLWVVSLRAGSLVESFNAVWAEVKAGHGGVNIVVPLELADTGAGLLGEARQRVVLDMLHELSQGLIDPDLVPE